MGSRLTAPLGFALVVALAGCSTAPYPTAPAKSVVRGLAQADGSAAGAVALGFCYNSQVNGPEELLAEARLACPNGEVAYSGSDVLWTPCGLLQPARATFVCTPTPSPEVPAAQ